MKLLCRYGIVPFIACLGGASLAIAQTKKSVTDWTVYALLGDAAQLDVQRLGDAVKARMVAEDALTSITPSADRLSMVVGRGSASISFQAKPLAAEGLGDACKHAVWYWREACDSVRTHRTHVQIVVSDTELRRVDSAFLTTKLLAAVMETHPGAAVFWGANLQSAAAFAKTSVELARENVPATTWVSYRYIREPSGNVSIQTRGMREFELMEMEARNVAYPGRELLEMVMTTARRLIMKGGVLADGETIGGQPGRRVHIKFAESPFTPGRRVYRVEIGS